MIRRVAFIKAIVAGVLGAVAWEVVMRLLILAGLQLFDLVRLLGTMVVGQALVWQWWLIGIAMHASVGAIWAIFYAYFFWSTYDWSPLVQGLVFSLGPAFLAGLIMIPQLGLMHPLILRGEIANPGLFALSLGWGGPVGVILGHLIFGAVMGSIYTRPVGHRIKQRRLANG